jgi:hypothetical protein
VQKTWKATANRERMKRALDLHSCSICGASSSDASDSVAFAPCELCNVARLCLLCAVSSEGLALCVDCRAGQEALCQENEAAIVTRPSCAGCAFAFERRADALVNCTTCTLRLCGVCRNQPEHHHCLACAVMGCKMRSDKYLAAWNGIIIPPDLKERGATCKCFTGPVCHFHREQHANADWCLNRSAVSCQRCHTMLSSWCACAWPQCPSPFGCIPCGGYCSRHLDKIPCAHCGARHFPRPAEETGRIAFIGQCCGPCFGRMRTYIECLLLGFRRTRQPYPKQMIMMLIKAAE